MNHDRSMTLAFRSTLAVALVACVVSAGSPPAMAQVPTDRQVVMFAVVATPNSTSMDPKITPVVAAQLRKTLPGHGFKLIQVKSQRVLPNHPVALDLGGGYETAATVLNPLDINGKVQIKFELTNTDEGIPQFQSIIATPTDQFNYFDKMMPDNSHVLIGVGAR
jgi:hypothetical protein